MTTTHTKDFGILRFMPIESFFDFSKRFDHEALVERLLRESLPDSPSKPLSVGDWPRVRVAIRRGGLFVVESETPSFTAMLRFSPEQTDAGDYEIHRRPRGGVERGRTDEVLTVAADETDSRLSMLAPFPTRHIVVTVGLARPHARMMWLVGLKEYRNVNETDETDESVA